MDKNVDDYSSISLESNLDSPTVMDVNTSAPISNNDPALEPGKECDNMPIIAIPVKEPSVNPMLNSPNVSPVLNQSKPVVKYF